MKPDDTDVRILDALDSQFIHSHVTNDETTVVGCAGGHIQRPARAD